MATFITLVRFTPQGIGGIKESPKRLDAAKQAFRAMGAELKQWYLVAGRYDAVVIGEAPDDETAMKLALIINSQARSAQRPLELLQKMNTVRLSPLCPEQLLNNFYVGSPGRLL